MAIDLERTVSQAGVGVIGKGSRVIEQRGIDRIPDDERRGTPRQVGLMWSGVVLNVQVVVYGALLVTFGLNIWQCVAAIVIGNLTWIVAGLCSLAGPAAGTTTFTVNRVPFGRLGNRPLAFFNWVMQLGYEVLDLVLMTLAVTALFGLGGITLSNSATVTIVLVLAVIQSVLPIVGHAAITRVLRTLIVPFGALFLMLAWLTAGRLHLQVTPPADWAVFLGGIALAASGSGLGWSPNAADYSRYLPAAVSRRGLVGWVLVGGGVPQSLLMLLGVAVASVVPSATDPVGGLPTAYPVWFVIPYLVLLVVQMIALNAVDLYSSGVTLQAIGIRVSRWQAVALDGVICAVVGLLVVLSGSFMAFVSNFLLFMIVWLAPWAGVFVVDHLLRKGRYDPVVLEGGGRAFAPAGIAAQAAGMIAALLWINTTVFVGPLASAAGGADLSAPAGFGVAALTYLLLARRDATR
ncbi:purine-cytosine permease family protein [Mycolicibacterium fluoranthenivorans]|uniref:Purine-cytosine permease n=1 Tax=Mycolicibacterium fluoranthenivorans TaxID=258505 RepID=A0A1G4V965_9MYCO|nr:cytosine permease [Mycolicibacterium fluoranthenivorans]SCX03185.1 Purine-cytosine permease [Mycolicibacterium fluoranthenivorans]